MTIWSFGLVTVSDVGACVASGRVVTAMVLAWTPALGRVPAGLSVRVALPAVDPPKTVRTASPISWGIVSSKSVAVSATGDVVATAVDDDVTTMESTGVICVGLPFASSRETRTLRRSKGEAMRSRLVLVIPMLFGTPAVVIVKEVVCSKVAEVIVGELPS